MGRLRCAGHRQHLAPGVVESELLLVLCTPASHVRVRGCSHNVLPVRGPRNGGDAGSGLRKAPHVFCEDIVDLQRPVLCADDHTIPLRVESARIDLGLGAVGLGSAVRRLGQSQGHRDVRKKRGRDGFPGPRRLGLCLGFWLPHLNCEAVFGVPEFYNRASDADNRDGASHVSRQSDRWRGSIIIIVIILLLLVSFFFLTIVELYRV
mmetsp:Transcript_55994/g.120500  ORF Transcript_55994/g.120500 Transcript_55994/m.120500 type:complete len:207 (+) Transcript_55994:1069-1689(+)